MLTVGKIMPQLNAFAYSWALYALDFLLRYLQRACQIIAKDIIPVFKASVRALHHPIEPLLFPFSAHPLNIDPSIGTGVSFQCRRELCITSGSDNYEVLGAPIRVPTQLGFEPVRPSFCDSVSEHVDGSKTLYQKAKRDKGLETFFIHESWRS
jgi:hypothetical protein